MKNGKPKVLHCGHIVAYFLLLCNIDLWVNLHTLWRNIQFTLTPFVSCNATLSLYVFGHLFFLNVNYFFLSQHESVFAIGTGHGRGKCLDHLIISQVFSVSSIEKVVTLSARIRSLLCQTSRWEVGSVWGKPSTARN